MRSIASYQDMIFGPKALLYTLLKCFEGTGILQCISSRAALQAYEIDHRG
jgi:hypothetical protein